MGPARLKSGRGDAAAEGLIRAAGRDAKTAYDPFYHSSMAAMIAKPSGSAAATSLLFAAQSLARVAPLAAEITSLVHFAATGQRPPSPDPQTETRTRTCG